MQDMRNTVITFILSSDPSIHALRHEHLLEVSRQVLPELSSLQQAIEQTWIFP